MRARVVVLMALGLLAHACSRPGRVSNAPPQPVADAPTLESRIAALDAEMQRLRGQLETLQIQNDSLRRNASRMESEIRERDEQIKAIRLELQRLKDIDLKPRPRPTP